MKRLALLVAALGASPASAEVVSSHPTGFHVRHKVTVAAAPPAAFANFAAIGRWWNPDHSYSGKASALSLDAKSGGCFCETLPTGGVEHMRVAHVNRPKRLV